MKYHYLTLGLFSLLSTGLCAETYHCNAEYIRGSTKHTKGFDFDTAAAKTEAWKFTDRSESFEASCWPINKGKQFVCNLGKHIKTNEKSGIEVLANVATNASAGLLNLNHSNASLDFNINCQEISSK